MRLSTEERIKRIEQAPKEVQTMVAKAFLRDDIDDEDVQYLFNTMTLEEMNDEDTVIENKDAEQPEGIGAVGFTMRTSKPVNNKQYITRGAGGWSNCIKGYPMDPTANVLANCVGYASGRFNELIQEARDFNECRYTNLRCNASGFIQRAKEASLEIGNTPKVGAIMCWGGGNGGCGHVAVVERVDSNNQVYTSESDYSGTTFYNAIRNNSNGRWGLSSTFYFQGFIYEPEDVQEWINGGSKEELAQPVPRDEYKNQIEVKVDDLRIRDCGGLACNILGKAKKGFYDCYEVVENNNYKWYRITNDWRSQWIASNDDWTTVYPAKDKFEVGDEVNVAGTYKIVDTRDGMACVFMENKEVWLPFEVLRK